VDEDSNSFQNVPDTHRKPCAQHFGEISPSGWPWRRLPTPMAMSFILKRCDYPRGLGVEAGWSLVWAVWRRGHSKCPFLNSHRGQPLVRSPSSPHPSWREVGTVRWGRQPMSPPQHTLARSAGALRRSRGIVAVRSVFELCYFRSAVLRGAAPPKEVFHPGFVVRSIA
jgi:hypothetical protein